MKRFLSLLLLIGVVSLPIGCDSPKSAPASPSSSGGSTNTFTYPFAGNIGFYSVDNYPFYNPDCASNYRQPGAMENVTGVAVSGNYLFVADHNDSYSDVQVFDLQGNFITAFYPDDAEGTFSGYTSAMTTDNKGHLFVMDDDDQAINVFNISDILSQAPKEEACSDLLPYATYWVSPCPESLAVDNAGNMYVGDPCLGGVFKVAPDFNDSTQPNEGEDVVNATDSGDPSINGGYLTEVTGVAVNAAGTRVYVSDYDNNVVQILDGDFNSLGFMGNAGAAASTLAGEFDGPGPIVLDNQGNLLVTENNNARVQRLTTSGSSLNMIGWWGSHSAPESGDLYSPAYVAVDAQDGVYVTDNNEATVFKYKSH